MKIVKTAAAALALCIAFAAVSAPADAFIRNKDVKAIKVVTKKITDPIVDFFHALFHK
ncbi:hypothetical protein BH10PSE9_BH10PSE9_21820 [soil metagenome]